MQPVAAGMQRADMTGSTWHLGAARLNVAERSTVPGGAEMWILFALVSLLLATARPVAAQFPTDVAVGSRVRVVVADSVRQQWAPSTPQWLRGDIAAISRDVLYLQLPNTEAPVPIRHSAIRRLDRSLGVPRRPESALRGAIAGALWGAFFLGLTQSMDQGGFNDSGVWDNVGEGAAIGAGAGFLLGAIFPTERWRHIRLR
jgi:hypothetical protein